jgi:uncharacterized protein (DUF736 family)
MADNKPNTGALFKNQYKESDNHPDYTGPFTGPNGEDMQIAAWMNKTKDGMQYMSLSVSEKKQKSEPAQTQDDLPF